MVDKELGFLPNFEPCHSSFIQILAVDMRVFVYQNGLLKFIELFGFSACASSMIFQVIEA